MGARGTESLQTLSWRELDSNFQYAGAVNLVVVPFKPAICGAHKLSLFTEFATRRYPADEAPKIAAAALKVFESQLRRLLASGGGMPISGAEDAIRLLRAAGIKVALTSGFDRGLITDIAARPSPPGRH